MQATFHVKVLFVCVQNAGRSQIAEALFSRAAAARHEARSAGTEPARSVHPEVVATLSELGLDVSHQVPTALAPTDAEWADIVVTMGCGDACPVLPGVRYVDWELADPAGRSPDEVRRIRDEIEARVTELVAELDSG
ncbi:arsenate reductase ArsC [soil metagenome]